MRHTAKLIFGWNHDTSTSNNNTTHKNRLAHHSYSCRGIAARNRLISCHLGKLGIGGAAWRVWLPGRVPCQFIISATLLLPAPGLALVTSMGAVHDPVLIGLIAGLGAALGEMTAYIAGYCGTNIVEDQPLTFVGLGLVVGLTAGGPVVGLNAGDLGVSLTAGDLGVGLGVAPGADEPQAVARSMRTKK